MNLQEIITAKVPGAVYTEAGDGMFTIPVEQFHDLARYLHDDPALRFDFLRSLTGMDWGEEGLGAVYHLESTATGENVVLKVLTPSREQCGLPTVSDIWKGAELNEREVFDFFGIGFINHPDMRRLYLRDDWVGYPLRKDYDQSGETNPLRMTNEVAHDSSPSYSPTAASSAAATCSSRRTSTSSTSVLSTRPRTACSASAYRSKAKSSKSSTYTAATSTGASKSCAKA